MQIFILQINRSLYPTYRCAKDAIALDIIQKCFPANRQVIGIDSTDIIWGLGSFPLFESTRTKTLK